jgi:hypothetical protein
MTGPPIVTIAQSGMAEFSIRVLVTRATAAGARRSPPAACRRCQGGDRRATRPRTPRSRSGGRRGRRSQVVPLAELLKFLMILTRMGGRAVEGTGLENRQGLTPLVGSNPTPSAISLRFQGFQFILGARAPYLLPSYPTKRKGGPATAPRARGAGSDGPKPSERAAAAGAASHILSSSPLTVSPISENQGAPTDSTGHHQSGPSRFSLRAMQSR